MATTELGPDGPRAKRVFIVEDHPVFRQGLTQIINAETGLTVCGQAENVPRALKGLARLKPDVVLVDITLPGKSGLELIKTVRATDRSIKLLAVSMHDEALYADRVLRAGADGYIMKQEDPEEILHAIRDVHAGRTYVSEEVLACSARKPQRTPRTGAGKRKQFKHLEKLADSELEILELVGQGKSNREVGRQLGVSAASVARQCAQMQRKLGLKHGNALICYAASWLKAGS
jgi:DNA-binding NarL/FixJ family response regulator